MADMRLRCRDAFDIFRFRQSFHFRRCFHIAIDVSPLFHTRHFITPLPRRCYAIIFIFFSAFASIVYFRCQRRFIISYFDFAIIFAVLPLFSLIFRYSPFHYAAITLFHIISLSLSPPCHFMMPLFSPIFIFRCHYARCHYFRHFIFSPLRLRDATPVTPLRYATLRFTMMPPPAFRPAAFSLMLIIFIFFAFAPFSLFSPFRHLLTPPRH